MHAVIGAVCDGRYLVRKAAGTCIKKRQPGALLRWKGNLSGLRGNAVYALWRERTVGVVREQLLQRAACKMDEKNEKKKLSRPECRIELNLKPALTAEQLDKRLLREFDSQKNKNFGNAIDGLFPARLIPVMLELSGIEPGKKVHEITKQERQKFAALIRKLPMTVEKTGEFAEAIITRGGVYVKDVNPSTMESKRLPGLYFAGEVLDVDALTGGFNLQVAWSTGYLAGTSAAGSNKGE